MTAAPPSSPDLPNVPLSPRFEEALRYAFRMHGGQFRKKTGRPYFGHVMGVAATVLQYGGDEEEAIAALLHDVVEDCGGHPRLEEIRAKFGERVAHIVKGCTDSFEQDPARKPPWRARKEEYVAHVRHADAETRLVSAADKLHNVREILLDLRTHGETIWARFSGGREGSLWYYRALVAAFRDGWSHPIADDFARAVAELESCASALQAASARPDRGTQA
jgi:GTP pyrophosphokinase